MSSQITPNSSTFYSRSSGINPGIPESLWETKHDNEDSNPVTPSPPYSKQNPNDFPRDLSPVPVSRIYSHLSSTSRNQSSRRRSRSRQYSRPNYSTSRENSHDNYSKTNVNTPNHSIFPQTNPAVHTSYTSQTSTTSKSTNHDSTPEKKLSAIAKLKRALEESASKNKQHAISKLNLTRTKSNIETRLSLPNNNNFQPEINKLQQKYQSSLEVNGEIQLEIDKLHASLITANMIHKQKEMEWIDLQETLEDRLSAKEAEIKKYLSSHISEKNQGMERFEEEKNNLINQYENEYDELRQQIKQMQTKLQEQSNNESWKSEAAFASLQNRLREAEELEVNKNNQIERLQNDFSDVISKNDHRIKELQVTLERCQEELIAKDEIIYSQEKKNERVQTQLETLKEEHQLQSEKMQQKAEVIPNLEAKLHNRHSNDKKVLPRSPSSSPSRTRNQKHMEKTFSDEIQSLQRSLDMMSDQLKTSKARSQHTIQELKSSLEELQADFQHNQAEMLVLKKRLLEKELNSLDSTPPIESNSSATIELSAIQLNNLRQSLDEKNMDLIEKMAEVEEKDFQIRAREQLVMELRNEISSLTDQVLQLQSAPVKGISDKFQEPSAQLNFLAASHTKITNLEAQISEARGDCKAKEEAISVMKRSLNEALSMLKPLQTLVANAEEEKRVQFQNYTRAKVRIDELEQELEEIRLNQSIPGNEGEGGNYNDQRIHELESELEAMEKILNGLERKEEQIRIERNNFEKAWDESKQELSTTKIEHQEKMKSLNSDFLQMQSSLRKARESESMLKLESQQMEDKFRMVGSLFNILQQVITNQDANEYVGENREISTKNHFDDISTEKINIYVDLVKTLERSRKELKQLMGSNREELEDHKQMLLSVEQRSSLEIEKIQRTLKEKTNELQFMEQNVDALRQKVSKLEETNNNFEEKVLRLERIEDDLEGYSNIVEEKENQIHALKSKLQSTDDELKETRKNFEKASEDLKNAKTSLLSYKDEIGKLKINSRDFKRRSSGIQIKLGEVKRQLKEKSSSEKLLNQKITEYEDKVGALEEELKELSYQNTNLKETIDIADKRDHGQNYSKVRADMKAIENQMQLDGSILSGIQDVSNDTAFGISNSFSNGDAEIKVQELEGKLLEVLNTYEDAKQKLHLCQMENAQLKEELQILEGEVVETVEEIEFLRETLTKREKELENAKYIATCSLMKLDELSGAADVSNYDDSEIQNNPHDEL